MIKVPFMTVLLGSIVNFHVDSQNIANFLGTVPVLGRIIRELELDSVFVNLPFIHNDVMKIKFLLYTEKNPNEPQELNLEDAQSFKKSNFNPKHPLKILIHGYLQSSNSIDFPISLKDAYLEQGKNEGEELSNDEQGKTTKGRKYNVICVDWSVLSKELIYFSSAVHTQKVGQRLGKFVRYLRSIDYIPDYDSVHLVGFSLGSHVSGIAGAFIQGITNGTENIGRITGLDPAGPGFITVPVNMRLDSGDAAFVDVIHTNGGSFLLAQYGTTEQIGHADFYPNGGSRQPACDVSLLTEFTIPRRMACNHLKSAEYFKRSIQREVLTGCFCGDWQSFQSGLCSCSQNNETAIMGEYCDESTRGRFYLYAT